LVLGIRGSAYRLCHNSKIQAIFRDLGGKPGLVLGLLGGPSKEIALATLSVSVDVLSANRKRALSSALFRRVEVPLALK
jgi:hypothetical protein